MINTDVLVVGGGPAGLSAAITAAEGGAKVIVLERDDMLGGQLVKQTHMFFGSKNEFAGTRGVSIAEDLRNKISKNENVQVLLEATAQGYYNDGIIGVSHEERFKKIKAQKIIVATGASEKMLPFPNNDLPGVYGAGAVQTLMNVYGVVPGKKVLMVGAGNIGLIVAYQLMQANIQVKAIVEAMPSIGGYWVHASKIRRLRVPIYTSCTLKEVRGDEKVEGVTISNIDKDFNFIPQTEKELHVDTVCLAVGLSPLAELLWQAECQMDYIPELCGYVPQRDENMKTSNDMIYIAGDVAGIEEASSAMVEGQVAGLNAAASLNLYHKEYSQIKQKFKRQLAQLRNNSMCEAITKGVQKATIKKGGDYVYSR